MKYLINSIAVVITFHISVHAQNENIPLKQYVKEADKLSKNKSVQLAMDAIDDFEEQTIADMILLTEIPAPPFKETKRAKKFREMLETIGVDSAWIDTEGNVLALRKGKKGNKTIVLDAHMDTVFQEETNVTVKREGNTYVAPGIGDNTRGMAMVLTVLKAMNKAEVETQENVVFVGTVGEEGLGDLRGVKHLFSDASDIKIGSWISIDGGSSGRIINGALGSKRYKAVFKGKGGHSWGSFGLANPHHAMGEAISLFVKEATKYTDKDGLKTSFNIGRIGGGTSVNSVPFESWMEVDMRSLDPKRLIKIDTIFKISMREAVRSYNASGVKDKISMDLVPIGDRPSGQLPIHTSLIQRALAASTFLGIKPKLKTGSTNSNIPIAKGIPATTLSRGGKGRDAHSLSEKWTNIDGAKNIKLVLMVTLMEAGIYK
ncbi:M20/M25/M40 family metallo-hydrolase [Aquimarina sp. BL5]|uniref:M20/M25/M40 family metallo-hydrolase n=1 Tax=Aquimarina sp. BL5 TaxID=1714860 RepID=UPI000E4D6AB5|nr:M20/M25/M40 family metallo-hydrolase [Aquimarina sp. BL5]AXT53959.1 M20/M25/M40 family metallo-hydrolase [Aquimarina sp. BL5]RKM99858.1 M20/M25/M40 family metallo-hydrolase [Aquimarina sp. BL5]